MQKILPATILTISFLFLVAPGFLSASTEESKAALERFEKNVVTAELSNGMKVFMYRRPAAPVFAGLVTARVGGVDEPIGKTGISHMLEHMAFKGTKVLGTTDYKREKKLLEQLEELAVIERTSGLSSEQKGEWQGILSQLQEFWKGSAFDREYKKRGATGLNASTSRELTNYYVNFPKTSFEFWAWVESERMINPVFRQFYKERDVVLEERRMRFVDEPMGRLFEKMMSTVYLEHPYRQPIIGYKRDLERLTASMTIDFLREYYVPQNVVVAVVGDIDPKKDLKILEKYFGRLSAGPDPKRTDIVEPEQEGQREFVLEADAEPYAAVAYRKPNYPHKDDAPLTIMGEIFAGSSISPLHRELVQKQQVATGIGYSEGPGSAYPNLFFFYLSPKKPNGTKEALAAYERELSKFKSKRVTEVQLKVAKRAIAMSYLKRFKSNMSLAKALTSAHLLYGDWKAMTKWYEEMLAVTAEDVQRVANKYLVPSYRTVGRIEKKVKDVS